MAKRKKSISFKLLKYFVFFIILLTVVQTAFELNLRYYSEVNSYEETIESIEDIYTSKLAKILSDKNIEKLAYEVKVISNLSGNPYLSIYDTNSKAILTSLNSSFCSSSYLTKELMLEYDNKIYGSLGIGICFTTLNDKIKSIILSTLFYELIKLLILSSIIILAINYLIVERIVKIASFTKDLNSLNLKSPLIIKDSNDEISDLVQSINDMRLSLLRHIEVLKNKEDIIKSMNERLEDEVTNRTSLLQVSNLELENTIHKLQQTQNMLVQNEKMASLGSLVAGISHEINTPIGLSVTGVSYIKELLDELQKNYSDNNMTEEEFKEYLDKSESIVKSIMISLNKAANLVRSFKQISVDQSSEIKREFNVYTYIEEIIISLQSNLKHKDISINIECLKTLRITSYPGTFSQILTNLIMNSLTHGFNSSKHKAVIKIEVTEGYNKLFLNYSDNGKGISKANLHKIFDPFYTTNRENGGTGLGLNIVYNLITSKLNGKIECKSKLKEGTKFIMNFELDS